MPGKKYSPEFKAEAIELARPSPSRHRDLIRQNGEYAQLYELQSEVDPVSWTAHGIHLKRRHVLCAYCCATNQLGYICAKLKIIAGVRFGSLPAKSGC